MTVELREYQQVAIDAVKQEWGSGIRSTLLAMATGTGKTETFLGLLDQEARDRVLLLVHRDELVQQIVERISRWTSLGSPGVVKASQNDVGSNLVVASVQTLSRKGRLEALLEASDLGFSHIVVDEAHHATAKTYRAVLDPLMEIFYECKLLGVTATPVRSDKDPLRQVFQSIAYRLPIDKAIGMGCLTPFQALGFALPVSFENVRETEEGWDESQVQDILDADNIHELVFEKWREHGRGEPTIAFFSSVKSAYSFAAYANARGVRALATDGTSGEDDRRGALDDFKSGRATILCNCALYTEGVDLPMASVLLQVRPTKSDLVYVQMAGRVLRLFPGKTRSLILDFAPADARDLRMAGDLLGKPRIQVKAEQVARDKGVVLESFGITSTGKGIDADPDDVLVSLLDYISSQPLAWTYDGRWASAAATDKVTFVILGPSQERLAKAERYKAEHPGGWTEDLEAAYRKLSTFQCFEVIHEDRIRHAGRVKITDTWDDAIKFMADRWETKYNGNGNAVTHRDRRWRRLKASDKQLAFMHRLGIPGDKEVTTAGEAAQAITHKLATDAVRVQWNVR